MNKNVLEKMIEMYFGISEKQTPKQDNEVFTQGDHVLIRCDRAGVFVGTFESRNGQEVVLSNIRWIWYWDGAASVFQLANEGVKNPENCKFPSIIRKALFTDVLQILPVTDAAYSSIMAVKIWEK